MIFVSFISIYYTIIIFCVFHACINCTCSIYLQWENWAERSVPSLGTRHCSLGVSSPSQRILWFSFLKLAVDPEPLRLDYLQKECCWHFQCCHRVQMVHVWRQMHLQRQGWGQNCWQKLMPVASLRNKDCVEGDDLVPRDNDAADAEARWATTVVSQRNLDSRRRPWSRRVDALLCLEHHLGVSTAQLLHNWYEQVLHMCNCSSNVQSLNKKNCTSSANPLYTLKHFITRPLISSSCPLCNDARHLSAGHYFTAKSHWTQLQLCEYGVTISEFKNTILQDIAVHTSACTGVNNGDCWTHYIEDSVPCSLSLFTTKATCQCVQLQNNDRGAMFWWKFSAIVLMEQCDTGCFFSLVPP